MLVRKILNNNLLLVEDEEGREQIAMGKGLRFSYKVGDQLKAQDVEKIYMPQGEKNTREYIRLLEEAPEEYVEVIQHAIEMVNRRMAGKLDEQIYVTLLDHLIFALQRQKQGIVLQNHMLWEIQKFYPKEYLVAGEVLEYINRSLDVELPEAESGNIAFHLVNAQIHTKNQEAGAQNGMLMVKMLKDIFRIVQLYYGRQMDEDSLDYSRFVVHVQFFLQRVLEDKMLESSGMSLYQSLVSNYPKAAGCMEQIRKYIAQLLNKEITEEEKVYLIVHLARVAEKGK